MHPEGVNFSIIHPFLKAFCFSLPFLQGISQTPLQNPVLSWDLNFVLSTLQKPPFEPIRCIPLEILAIKIAFLGAIMFVRRVSELAALSCKEPFLFFYDNSFVLRPRSSFFQRWFHHSISMRTLFYHLCALLISTHLSVLPRQS